MTKQKKNTAEKYKGEVEGNHAITIYKIFKNPEVVSVWLSSTD